ncbi:Dihydropyrimidinase [Dirofilaria immitis]
MASFFNSLPQFIGISLDELKSRKVFYYLLRRPILQHLVTHHLTTAKVMMINSQLLKIKRPRITKTVRQVQLRGRYATLTDPIFHCHLIKKTRYFVIH